MDTCKNRLRTIDYNKNMSLATGVEATVAWIRNNKQSLAKTSTVPVMRVYRRRIIKKIAIRY